MIELLVVIAIIAILAAMLMPVLNSARARSKQSACASNLRQVAMASLMYAQDYEEHLPYVLWSTQYQQFQLLGRYAPNLKAFQCPSARHEDWDLTWTAYFCTTTNGQQICADFKLNDNTIILAAKTHVFRDPTWVPIALDLDWEPRTRHGAGQNLAFLDGHVEWKTRERYQPEAATAVDPFGCCPWWRWGLVNGGLDICLACP